MEKSNENYESAVFADEEKPLANIQRVSRQLYKFFGKVQSAESRGDTSYRSMLKHFRLLALDGRNSDYFFDAMQILYCDVPAQEDGMQYTDNEMQAFIATLKLYALAYCTQNRTPHVQKARDGEEHSKTLATACGEFARTTQTQKWCNDRLAAFLESKSLSANFRYLENLVSRMGKSGFTCDYVQVFKDLSMMFAKNRKLGTDIRKRWAEQYVRSVNRIENIVLEENEGE